MPLHVVDHPLVAHRVGVLRDVDTGSAEFRRVSGELAGFLVYEATRSLATEPGTVPTPLGVDAPSETLRDHQPLLVPILRAGLALLEGALVAVPTAEVGLVGLARDEETKEPAPYCVRLPAELAGTTALVLDPMLATGGSLAWTVHAPGRAGRGPGRRGVPHRRARGRGADGRAVPGRRDRGRRPSTPGSTSGRSSSPASGTPAIGCTAASEVSSPSGPACGEVKRVQRPAPGPESATLAVVHERLARCSGSAPASSPPARPQTWWRSCSTRWPSPSARRRPRWRCCRRTA
jgi:uracil phosphoribosyltransferase